MTGVQITSFGYGHSEQPTADLTIDARRNLRNPHHDPAMRTLTGLDRTVREHVLATPGASALVGYAVACTAALAAATGRDVTVATGCVGGRHRSVALAEEIAAGLRSDHGMHVTVTHRDVAKPVIQS
ncbi:RNase adapter RapZ [Streptosporangium sp. NPDC002544]|uniref:RapZ C-terminal domain-containing protein n=1 Tax=Streptosporangium sp. NPDC002544 TaxID=3154538 RepID=UPI00332B549C